jgi:hypothetical protein
MAIPLLPKNKRAAESVRAEKHGTALLRLIRKEGMTFDETLRAYTGVLFWSKPARRKRLIAWLTEFLKDLQGAKYNPEPADLWGEDPN